ncbi:MAG: dTDP-4-dehydrorhamnose reductase [Treponema sp.]|nr:dTDP-4-dehydrorhamnose reductase [Treponema sp.]
MVWVIGCNGMLGTELCREFKNGGIEFTGTDRNVDMTDFSSLESFSSSLLSGGKKIDFIVNCAAYTAVDKAESDEAFARKLNSDGPGNIARLAKKIGAKLVHISTDYVFDGSADSPLTENMKINPLGVYGKTKAEGESAVAAEASEFYILRTSWLYGWDGKNFVYTMIRAMNTHESVKVVNDQRGTPTFCADLANVILTIIRSGNVPFGIYHVSDLGETTWFGFAEEIKRLGVKYGFISNTGCTVNPCLTFEYPTPAKRPAYSVFDKSKIISAVGNIIPEWKISLEKFMQSDLFDRTKIV